MRGHPRVHHHPSGAAAHSGHLDQDRAGRGLPSRHRPNPAVNAASTAAFTAVSLACARCSRRSMSPCAVVPSDAQSVAAR